MNMELKTINEEVYDCYLIALATVLNSMGMDYQMISTGYWNFEYVPLSKRADSQIGNGIKPYERRSVEGEKLFHGVELNIGFDGTQKKSAKTVIHNLLQKGKIAIIVSDAFFCPWSTYYQKMRFL